MCGCCKTLVCVVKKKNLGSIVKWSAIKWGMPFVFSVQLFNKEHPRVCILC